MSTAFNSITEETGKNVSVLDKKETNKPKNIIKREIFLSRLKRKIFKQVWIVRLLLFLIFISTIFFGIFSMAKFFSRSGIIYYYGLARDFIFLDKSNTKIFEDRTNFLILGKGGEGHEAPDLTDTIILASVSYKDPHVVLISLPRDIWIPSLRAKLNSVYYWGNQKQDSGGIALAKATVEEISNLPVHYGVVIDFSGLKKIVDVFGEINVYVQNSFIDEKYPIAGRENDLCNGDTEYKCRYEKIEFSKGFQQMDGETVLKFVRSRNSQGEEGTDFARAERQQKVVEAIKNKVLSRDVLLSPKKILRLRGVVLEYIETDITPSSAVIILRRIINIGGKIEHFVLPENLLEKPEVSKKYDNLYVFIPKEIDINDPLKRSWKKIDVWIKCVLSSTNCEG